MAPKARNNPMAMGLGCQNRNRPSAAARAANMTVQKDGRRSMLGRYPPGWTPSTPAQFQTGPVPDPGVSMSKHLISLALMMGAQLTIVGV